MTTQPSDWAVDLLPCPFCGNDVNDDEGCFQVAGFRPPSTPAFSVRCGNPSCNADVTDTSRESAIKRWNTRAPVARELDASGGGFTDEQVQRAWDAFCEVANAKTGDDWGEVDPIPAMRAALLTATPRPAEAATTNSAQISSEVVVGDWLPIESAPKDGTHLWLFSPDDHPMSGYWLVTSGDDFHWEGWMFSDEILSDVKPDGLTPTHWRPLPPAPQAAMGAVGAGGGE